MPTDFSLLGLPGVAAFFVGSQMLDATAAGDGIAGTGHIFVKDGRNSANDTQNNLDDGQNPVSDGRPSENDGHNFVKEVNMEDANDNENPSIKPVASEGPLVSTYARAQRLRAKRLSRKQRQAVHPLWQHLHSLDLFTERPYRDVCIGHAISYDSRCLMRTSRRGMDEALEEVLKLDGGNAQDVYWERVHWILRKLLCHMHRFQQVHVLEEWAGNIGWQLGRA